MTDERQPDITEDNESDNEDEGSNPSSPRQSTNPLSGFVRGGLLQPAPVTAPKKPTKKGPLSFGSAYRTPKPPRNDNNNNNTNPSDPPDGGPMDGGGDATARWTWRSAGYWFVGILALACFPYESCWYSIILPFLGLAQRVPLYHFGAWVWNYLATYTFFASIAAWWATI